MSNGGDCRTTPGTPGLVINMINRSSVAGADLQTPLLLSHSISVPLWNYL